MTKSSRPFAVAAALLLTLGSGLAAAQTLIARRAPIGSTVELFVNGTKAGSAQADAAGDATIPFKLPTGAAGKNEEGKNEQIDARVYVDTCGESRRVLVVARDVAPIPPEAGCVRQEVTGIFNVRRITSLVVNVGDPIATVLLRQGSYSLNPRGPRRQAPTGLVIFGGGAFTTYANALEFGCAGVPTCTGDERGLGYTVGADYWITRYLAVEGSYIRPAHLTVAGSGEAFHFDSFFEPHLFTGAGKVGIPVGPVRFYGRGGFNYHRGESGTTQVIDAVSVTVDGVTTTTPGSTQTVEAKTDGWGWLVGGGAEIWVTPAFAFYGEYGGAGVKGSAEVRDQGQIDNRVMILAAGVRIKLGRW
jgi:hypothetical protein